MSDTPRTDCGMEFDDSDLDSTRNFARQLERELDAANERIKRLEESLASIRDYWNRDQNEKAMADACWYSIETASDALGEKGQP